MAPMPHCAPKPGSIVGAPFHWAPSHWEASHWLASHCDASHWEASHWLASHWLASHCDASHWEAARLSLPLGTTYTNDVPSSASSVLGSCVRTTAKASSGS